MKSLFLPLMSLLLFTSANQLLAQDCKVLEPNLEGVYTGDCKNGKGEMTDDQGILFKGNFKKGKRDGEGILYLKDSTQNGFWKNDKYIGLYESPYKVVNKTFMVSSLSVTYDNPNTSNNNTIELNVESVSGGNYSVLQGEIPKPVLKESIFHKGSYLQMISVTNEQKRNTYIFQNTTYPADVIFKINNEEVEVLFNEVKNYKVNIKLRN